VVPQPASKLTVGAGGKRSTMPCRSLPPPSPPLESIPGRNAAPHWPRCTRSGRAAREGGPHQNCVAARECGAMLDRDTGTHYVTRGLLALGHDVRQVPPVHAKPFRQTHKMTFEMRMRLLKPCNAPRLGAYHRRRTNSLIYRRCIACATAWWRNEPRSSIRSAAFSWSTDAKGT